jgi:hypothetical protein
MEYEKRSQKYVCIFVGILLGIAGTDLPQVLAQTREIPQKGKLVIDTRTDDVFVELKGRYQFFGKTPYQIPYKLYGPYKITAKKQGYETYNASVFLDQRGANRVIIRMNPRNRGKSFIRSTVLPGWGQFYGQGVWKGLFVSLVQGGLITGTIISSMDYGDKKDLYDQLQQNFDRIKNNQELAASYYPVVQQGFARADDARKTRNTWLYASIGFWVYNMLDSIIFFSRGPKERAKIAQNRMLLGYVHKNEVGFSLKIGF